MDYEIELITYYVSANGDIEHQYKGLTSSFKDREYIKQQPGNRVVYPGFMPTMWREIKPSGLDVAATDIPITDLPKSVQALLPKELQMLLLVGAV